MMINYLKRRNFGNIVKPWFQSVAIASLLLGANAVSAQSIPAPDGCINSSITNGGLVANPVGSATNNTAGIAGWTQTDGVHNYWFSTTSIYRDGIEPIRTKLDNSNTTAYLYQYISNAAVENDSLTIIIWGSLDQAGNRIPKLNIYWTPAGTAFNATSQKRAEVKANIGGGLHIVNGFNNSQASIYMSPTNGLFSLAVRIAHGGLGSSNGILSLKAELESGSTGDAYVFLNSVFMPSAICAATNPISQLPFDCDAGYGYLIQDTDGGNGMTVEGRTSLRRVNVATGASSIIFPHLLDQTKTDFVQMNALGYNPVDNYLWAKRFGTHQLVRIGADGSTALFTIPGLYGIHGAADIDANGIYYLYNQYTRIIDRVDLNTMTLMTPIAVNSVVRSGIIDIAINPLNEMLYAVAMNGNIANVQMIDPATGTGTDLYNQNIGIGSGFGALYFDDEGNLYGSNNATGQIWKFSTTAPYVASFIASGVSTASNDGARCPIKLAILINISGKVWHDANGDATVNGTEEVMVPYTLFANLVNDHGEVVMSVAVGEDGNYLFENVEAVGLYDIILTHYEQPEGSVLSEGDLLTSEWEYTGTNVDGIANTGNRTGAIRGVASGGNNITGLDFGVQQPPLADPKQFIVSSSAFSVAPPADFPAESGFRSIPLSSSSLVGYETGGSLSGSDPEDCATAGSCNTSTGTTFTIHTINSNTKLYYDFGTGPVEIDVTGGPVTIQGFDVDKMVLYAEEGSGETGDELGFTYSITDAAGAMSDPVSYSIITSVPLSVDLILFEAFRSQNTVILNWLTASENENEVFEIEHSINANQWNRIGKVQSKAEAGNVKHEISYQFIDNSPAAGMNYYRLKQVGFNGNTTYTSIRQVMYDAGSVITLHPNPVEDNLVVSGLTGAAIIRIYNIVGQLIKEVNASDKEHVISMSAFEKGVYIIRISTQDGAVFSKKVVKSK